ncbi:MAG: FHA domain-containing protein [Chloroflexi bacterium]|nr:FHA domain-containing protein [Chloroflexota bacterium]
MFNVTVTILKATLLAGLYVFLLVVLRTIYRDMRAQSSSREPRIVALKGAAERGASRALSGVLTVGREVDPGLSLDDPFISTVHARFVPEGERFAIEDLGSTNGTFVNGIRINGAVSLKPGDRIKLGETIFQYLE